MPFETAAQAEDFIFSSYMKVASLLKGPDSQTRLPDLTRQLLDALGQPEGQPDQHFTSIVVTGSKGKGSISLLTAKLLEGLGYRVGLVTSPHIKDFRERIRIQGRSISPEDLIRHTSALEAPARQIMSELRGLQYFSPTGLILALACRYFAEQRVDFAVIEAGRGGRFDDCIVLDNPLALFGPIMLEHPAQLGATPAEIAASKAPILKAGCVGVTVAQTPEVQAVLQDWAWQVGGQLLTVGQEVSIEEAVIESHWLRLKVQGRINEFDNMRVPIPALYEAENTAVALAAIEMVSDERILAPQRINDLRQLLATARWPGRLQILSENPLTVLDCAVTGPSAQSVLASLQGRWRAPLVAIVGVPADRDWPGVLDSLKDYADTLILTRAAPERLTYPAEAAAYARQLLPPGVPVLETPDFAAAQALLAALPSPPRTILVLGTQAVIAQALRSYGVDLEQL